MTQASRPRFVVVFASVSALVTVVALVVEGTARATTDPAGTVATSAAEAAPEAVARLAPGATGQASLVGPIGLFETSTAEVGPVHQLRAGLHGEFFSASDFLIAGDSDQRLRGGVVVGYTPHRQLELFGAILSSSNRNDRTRDAADRDPALLKSFGDLVIGGKGVVPVSPAATVGFELGIKLLAGVSDLSISPSATSLWLGPVFSYDLREGERPIPLRLHAAASYYADNSSNLHDLSNFTRNTREAAMFGYGIAQSRVRLALAADAPLPRGRLPLPIDPFLEYHVEVVTGSADPAFADYAAPACGKGNGTKACIDNRDLHWLTFGARAAVYRRLIADVGVDVRLRSPGFPYGAPLPPYNVIFGLSLPIDFDDLTRTVVVTKTIEVPAALREGYVTGTVRSAGGGKPVAGAIIAVGDRPHTRVVTDLDGVFTTLNLPPGPVELEVTASNFEPIKVVTTVVGGKAESVAVSMTAKTVTASVHGRVATRDGRGVEATLKFTGRAGTDGNFEASSDATGAYTLSLPVGAYRVRAGAPRLPAKELDIALAPEEDKSLDFTLRPVPQSPNAQLAGEWIRLGRPLRFAGASAHLTAPSEKLLEAVADLLDAHGEIRHVQIVAHWDSSLDKAGAASLTVQQAEAVKGYLVARGIGGERLSVAGAGSDKPLVPNLSPANRMRNRRVELHLE